MRCSESHSARCRQAAEQTRASEVLLTRLKGDVQVSVPHHLHEGLHMR